eukprot:2756113-Amphidinium_carterae.1
MGNIGDACAWALVPDHVVAAFLAAFGAADATVRDIAATSAEVEQILTDVRVSSVGDADERDLRVVEKARLHMVVKACAAKMNRPVAVAPQVAVDAGRRVKLAAVLDRGVKQKCAC